ncbi:peptide ABC transporter substrate-binding protein [Clostridium novyi B str. ATCC 27606]|uniref:Peptide ABC transporter substrate-binding protein n=2 Tax=Clostridium TaxID=1485 RepID=A0AA40IUB3_CLONO|nr:MULTISPECIES: peptide ABC transporter substrate-binding protein [Clostridium]KEI12520.1 peptide ABC transporter substrate-binding protein [Clostridium novyi B str. NCTC 9691]KEI16377.1 peptide ABC transporter substrate-binding protein [Clostridium novyi B str. ATCC 27606]KEI18559.1 peptide ABC transporter substrate-binding protein [Clostridium haemolyticum NCTC 9693]KGN04581.1 peptide ABC transporter substrate-binding protein [Clostridium haemolyticum NCTC 8350]CAG7840137.1 Oligopeptide-bin
MKRKVLAVLLTTALATTMLFTGCGSKQGANGAGNKSAQNGGILNVDLSEIKTLDSAQTQDTASGTAVNAAFEGLTRVNNTKVELAVAKECKVSDDKKTYTFTLKDLKWTDGKPVTAKDFEYAWKRLVDPKTKAPFSTFINGVVKNATKISTGKGKVEELGVKAKDDKTLVVELEKPVPYFEEQLAHTALFPQRKDIVEAQGDKYGSDPSKMVFNGPFVIESWQKGSKTILKKNDKYYDTTNVKLDKIVLQDIKELPTKYQMFSSKQLDLIQGTGEYAEKLKKDADAGKCNLRLGKTLSTFYMMFNMNGKNKLLMNPKIRLALSLAVDRETYINRIYKRGFVSYGLIPDTMKCGDKDFRKEVPEPLKEIINQNKDPKALFIEGLKELKMDEDPSKYTLNYMEQGSDAFRKQCAEYYQNQWKTKLGVNITIKQPASFADYLTKCQAGEFDIAVSGWIADFNDPLSMMASFMKNDGNNHSKYYNTKYEEAIKKAEQESDSGKRLELFKQAENIIVAEDAGISPIFSKDVRVAEQKKVKGVQSPACGCEYEFKWASVEK